VRYRGEWRDGQPHGQGTLALTDGSKYVGGFKHSQFNGEGTLTLSNGSEFEGEFRAGKWHGKGTLKLNDGLKYIGGFDDGVFRQGALISPQGYTIVEGTWRDGDVETAGGRWRFAASTESTNYFILTESIRREGAFRRAWMILGDNQPVKQTGHLSARSLTIFDCTNERIQTVEMVFFSGSFGTGNLLGSHQDNTWNYVAPGTAISTVMKYVCDYKLTPKK